jgi:hypothetical protein
VKFRMTLLFSVLCLTMILIGARSGLAQAKPQEPAWLTRMYAEGWQKVQEGVLQRSKGGQAETFTFGEEGLRYTVENLKQQVNFLQQAQNQHPSPELGQAISNLQRQIGGANARLSTRQAVSPSSEEMSGCDISYGAHAYADYLRDAQAPGVTASADAYFHTNCGFTGSTYAYAYVEASNGSVFSTKTQEDPKPSGSWLDSAVQWSLSGSTNCSSRSYARAWSDSLGINYETSAQNYVCPPPPPPPPSPLSVVISGASNVYTDNYSPCADVTWTASASGGTPGYTYYWYSGSTYEGSGYQLTKQYCYTNATVTPTVVVYDSGSPQQSAQASYTTNIYYTPYYDACTNDPYSCECNSNYCCNQYPRRPYQEFCPITPYQD